MDLKTFFEENHSVALGFSGGVDSSYLLYSALHYGAQVKAYYVKTAFQPQFELEDALRIAKELRAEVCVIEIDVLSNAAVAANPANRCYYCKKEVFGAISQKASEDGYSVLIDGSNASDDANDRPGMKALTELEILSPLRMCGLNKDSIRHLSKEAGLFTWNKPAYACLATRIATDRHITRHLLSKVERSEGALAHMGFTDFRVRLMGDDAKLQLPQEQMEKAVRDRKAILTVLEDDFNNIMLDLKGR